MPHKRSFQGKISQWQREKDYSVIKVQRKGAWQIISDTEFRDRLIGETVCRTDINTITDELAKLFGQPETEGYVRKERSSESLLQKDGVARRS